MIRPPCHRRICLDHNASKVTRNDRRCRGKASSVNQRKRNQLPKIKPQISSFSTQRMRNNLENNRLRGIPDSSPTAGTSAAHPIQSQSQMSQNNTGFTKQINPSSSSYHRKSQSLDAATISSQIVNTSMLRSVGNSAANKNKGYSYNER